MFKDVLQQIDLALLMKTALVIFFACFVAVVFWALSRPRQLIQEWARLPLSSEDNAPAHEEMRS